MSCKGDTSSSKSIKFAPMPMSALIANLKPLQTAFRSPDSWDNTSGDDSDTASSMMNVLQRLDVKNNASFKNNAPANSSLHRFKKKVEILPVIEDVSGTVKILLPQSNDKEFDKENVGSNHLVLPTCRTADGPTEDRKCSILGPSNENVTSEKSVPSEIEEGLQTPDMFKPSCMRKPMITDMSKPSSSCIPKTPNMFKPCNSLKPKTPDMKMSSSSRKPKTPVSKPSSNHKAKVTTPTIKSGIRMFTPCSGRNSRKKTPRKQDMEQKKESVRCLFPDPVNVPKETPKTKTGIYPATPMQPDGDNSHSLPSMRTTGATPSQPQGSSRSHSKVQFKTINIKGKRYMFIKKLGTGGSSQVFKVLEMSTSSEYAVKCVDLAIDKEMAQGYLNEVRVLRELQKSDRVIRLYGYEYDKTKNFLRLVMEVGETDLASFLKAHRHGIPIALVTHYWEEMLRAVEQIHEHGIVHADLKPANFLLVSGRLKLIDFGIASAVSSDATSVLRPCGAGTFSYISPEALGGDGSHPIKISFYSDVWSLGCILYSLVYGRTPFGHLPNMAKLASIRDPRHVIEYPPTENFSPSLISTLRQCLQYDGHSRPTVRQLLQQLEYSRPLPQELLDKLRPYCSREEYQLLVNARVDMAK